MQPARTPMPSATSPAPQVPSAGKRRVLELDGLRGWASLCVVGYHVVWQIFGVQVPGVRGFATAFILDGPMAVAVFFVLSGDALGSAALSSRRPVSFWRLLLKRYIRLTIPICAVCLVIGLLKAGGFVYNVEAAKMVGQSAYFGGWLPVAPTLTQTLGYAFAGVFREDGAATIDRFLWTMPIEAVGSCCVFATIVCARWTQRPHLLILALFEAALCETHVFGIRASYVACFFAGLYFAVLHAGGTFAALRTRARAPLWSGAGVGILVVGESLAHLAAMPDVTPLLANVLVFCVLCNEPLCRALRSPLSQWLGRISFPLYLVQFPVLVSATSYAIVVAGGAGYLQTCWISVIAVGSIAVSLAAASMFEPVDRFAMALSRQVTAPGGWVRRRANEAGSHPALHLRRS